MKENELLYQIKELEKNIGLFLTKGGCGINKCSPPTPTQIRIVNYILRNDKNNIYQKDLEKNLNLTRATLSGVLKTMEKNGILNRVINDNDARSKKIILNDKIEKVFLECQNKLFQAEDILVKDISQEEIVIFKSILNKMKKNICEYNERDD